MAKIVHSSLAPSEAVTYSLGNTSFEIDGSKKTAAYETDDPTVLSDARVHPWLDVVVEKVDQVEGLLANRLDPTKDPLSAQHENARLSTSADAAREFQEKQVEELGSPVAIQAGLDQKKVVKAGPVSETLAAADEAITTTSKEKK